MFGTKLRPAARNRNTRLPAITHMGAVRLRVKDMQSMLDFYTKGVGLDVLAEKPGEIELGSKTVAGAELGSRTVLTLEHDPDLRHPARTEAGLFHVAILFDTKHDLALSLVSTLSKYQERYQGPGDHLVSQAFYFSDPEGNGVELYWDRPRDQWTWQNGQVLMDTLYIDATEFIRENISNEEIVHAAIDGNRYPLTTRVGHVHLQVGDTATAHKFYVGALGFDQTASVGTQALFVSAGGYHHHMAVNVWNSRGAAPRTKTLGLSTVNVQLPNSETVEEAADRLRFHGIKSDFYGESLRVNDPWNNTLLLNPAG